jgi:REP element-mobilizing transposase RayT
VHRLRPSTRLNQIVSYIVAVKAKQYGILLHAIVVMSNHWHLVCTDPDGRSPEFTRDCHALIGRHINCAFGDLDSLWSSEQTSQVELGEPTDIVDKIAYTMANPVAAGLVRYGHSWPGIRMRCPRAPQTIARPKGFFRDEADGGKLPAQAVLEFHRPPGHDELSDDELAELLDEVVEAREQRLRDESDREGKTFLGRGRVLRQSRHSRAQSIEPPFGLSPRVAAKNQQRRIEILKRNRAFQTEYRHVRERWLAGERDVEFPYGTYQLRLEAGVSCAPPPT